MLNVLSAGVFVQLLQAMEDAELAKLRGRVLHASGALESDVFLLFSDHYTTEGDMSAGGEHRQGWLQPCGWP